jgi:hypothetical protein
MHSKSMAELIEKGFENWRPPGENTTPSGTVFFFYKS